MLHVLLNGKTIEIEDFNEKNSSFCLFFCSQIRFILHCKKTGFVVEHDFIMATYLADRVIVFDGEPSMKAHASEYAKKTINASII